MINTQIENKVIPSAPAPEVQYLPSIFRKIQTGDIKVPAFQREFVWTEAQILELLESIYQGFPIGSMLFWRVEKKVFRIARPESTSFPEAPENYPLSYVLDGLQRLSTLYGCFHWKDKYRPSLFNVVFDLRNEQFRHYDRGQLPEYFIHLSSIFSPKLFLESQGALMNFEDGDRLINNAIKLHSTFQEYLIPTVTISGRELDEVVSIFERINSTGTRLSAVDFLRAVTWAEEFDLNDELEKIADLALSEGFEIPYDTLAKVLAVSLGIPPTTESMADLRNYSSEQLQEAVQKSKESITKILRFLKERLRIRSYDFVPYEGQFLVLIKYSQISGDRFPEFEDEVMRWFWTTSFDEGLRGKPDHYVARLINSVETLVQGNRDIMRSRLMISPSDLVERRFIKGKALSSAIANLFALSDTRSLIDGQPITPEAFMSEFSSRNFDGLLSSQEANLLGTSRGVALTNKSIANIILVRDTEKRLIASMSARDLVESVRQIHKENASEIFKSQMLYPKALERLEEGDDLGFLNLRSRGIWERISELTNR